ncbi:MAG TPA: hypothetical protein VFG30_15805 [Polyangiales bacterium]|nr:hypothetical protein [Polyangiales bacterium]
MLTEFSILALPFALRGLLRREARRDEPAGIAAPPRRSTPPSSRGPSEPPPRPERADSDRRAQPEWTAGIGADPSTHERLAIASIYGMR